MEIYVDIGNTHTVFGIFESNPNQNLREDIEKNLIELRFSTRNIETPEDIYSRLFPFVGDKIKNGRIELNTFVVSSVVPQINFVIERFVEKYVNCQGVYWVEARNDLGIDWQTDEYKQMGADRVADILGATYLFNDNFVIIDFGTAITVDVIVNRKYLGGSISPGFMLLVKSLFQETAKLPMVEIKPTFKIVENTTIGQIQLGTVDVISRGINSILLDLKKLYPNLKIILTGGFSSIAKDIIECDEVIPKLQFIGMNYYHKLVG
ncbi:MAG: type III pantothenate kinase [Candidatus Calescibacterium sp.]|nr:type III pantothenate kinase [Candidatus Calescibacterium sp.]MCX7972655.1 type III pantothenate kinase [bacterium]MDW8194748.1 type III pantothenate kinase [Candidatus Calescibacterium sp.]